MIKVGVVSYEIANVIVNSGFYGKKFSAAKFFYCLALIRALMSLNLIIFSSSDPIMS